MPFGAQVLPAGGVRFRLWAPAAGKVELVLPESGKTLAMEEKEPGWFELAQPEAAPGARYRYRIDEKLLVPDPASRFQPDDAEGPSEVIDPGQFEWQDRGWAGRPWNEAVIYELHVGAFSSKGSYPGVEQRLRHLRETGVTAIELMPLADFAGRRNWGYDGVLPFAPDSSYGRPEDLKALVESAHSMGMMVLLDVVYNHFGPKGNFLHAYAPQFFTGRHSTPWGAAIDFGNRWVREYFIHNALYWLGEYGLDGLRFDAVHAIFDESPTHFLDELASRVGAGFKDRQIHLILENDANQARFLGPGKYTAQWNDDAHHGYHVLATDEGDGYYVAYADQPARHLARCLAEGFAYQGEVSPFTGEKRGEKSTDLPLAAFVDFLQNHDQIGNRAYGERLSCLSNEKVLRTLTSILLLAPSPPLVFMGEEWGCRQPFLFFCDFEGELGEAVRKGRREEFARFAAFRDPLARARIPDPLAESTFKRSQLRWKDATGPDGTAWLAHYRKLLEVRTRDIAPRIPGIRAGRYRMLAERAFEVVWTCADGARLELLANCGDERLASVESPAPSASRRTLWNWGRDPGDPWSAHWWLAA